MQDPTGQARSEFRSHWTLVLAASVGFAFSSVVASSMGIFMEPIGKEFGWSRTLLSSALSIAALVTAVFSPVFGAFIDRWGTRRMALFGTTLAAGMIAWLSQLSGSATQWIGFWLFYAVAGLMTKSTVWTAAVASVFTAGRGTALGLTLSGTAVAQAIIPPLTNGLIESYGWRMAYVWLGLGGGAITLVVLGIWLRDGYDLSRRRAGAVPGDRPNGPLLDMPGLSIAQAWRSGALWRVGISTFVMMVITIALNVHQFPILTAAGVPRGTAALYASVAGAAGIVGKLVTGTLLDRYPGRWVGGLTLALTSVTFILLLLPGQNPAIIVTAMFVNGYAAGTKLQIAGYLTVAYGGMRHFGAIFGAMASLIALGSGLGPLVGGLVFDIYGTYDPFLIFGIAGTLFSAGLIFGLGAYPKWSDEREVEAFA